MSLRQSLCQGRLAGTTSTDRVTWQGDIVCGCASTYYSTVTPFARLDNKNNFKGKIMATVKQVIHGQLILDDTETSEDVTLSSAIDMSKSLFSLRGLKPWRILLKKI